MKQVFRSSFPALVVGGGAFLLLATPAVCGFDCNSNGIEDRLETAEGVSLDCNADGVPDECDIAPVNFGLRVEGGLAFFPSSGEMRLADLDGDGDPDLVVSDPNDDSLRVYLNTGGSFSDERRFRVPLRPSKLALADLDGDGDLDLAVTQPAGRSVAVMLNRGDGSFSPPVSHGTAGILPSSLAVADVDGDGGLDLVAAGDGSEAIAILRNVGGGDFDAAVRRVLGAVVHWIASADLDSDGDRDLLIRAGDTVRLILPGGAEERELGTFENGATETAPAVGDFDGDGDVDLAVVSENAGRRGPAVRIYRNRADGTLEAERAVDLASGLFVGLVRKRQSIAAADLDGDGSLDLLVIGLESSGRQSDGVVSLLRNHGDGSFASPVTFRDPQSWPLAVIAGDLDGDGRPEPLVGRWGGLGIAILGEDRVAYSADCDRNGTPDECDIELAPYEDCNRNGIPDSCDLAEARSGDCNENGRPDECDVDCNENGVADECEVAASASADLDADGVLDECEPRYMLGFGPPREVRPAGAGRARVTAPAQLSFRLPVEGGVQGWSLSLRGEGCDVVAATTAGTVVPERLSEGFEKTMVETVRLRDGDVSYVMSAVVLSFTLPVALEPSPEPYDLLLVTAESAIPPGEECGTCRLLYEIPPHSESFNAIVLTVDGATVWPEAFDRTYRPCPRFRRGDGNSDGRVDISDAIRTFMYLFLGATEPPCLDAADANDDGRLDLSDGIRILEDFFRPGTAIPPPGPFECGVDPSGDGLGCAEYPACAG